MNIEKQTELFHQFTTQMEEIMLKKGNDYANIDRLSNFKLAGNICGISPEKNCLSLMATKIARLGVLLENKKPNNESIEDSIIDLANYSLLLGMLIKEKNDICCGNWDELGLCKCSKTRL